MKPEGHCYQFCDHIHHLFVDDRLILLDARRNRYLFIDPPVSILLRRVLIQPTSKDAASAPVLAALSQHVLQPSVQTGPIRQANHRPAGIGLHEWQLPFASPPVARFLRAWILSDFVAIAMQIRLMGLERVFKRIRQLARQPAGSADAETSRRIASLVRDSSKWLPFRTACLENAVATAVWLSRRTLPFQFRIGFQLDPFLAHAWINVDDQVLLDRPDLNQAMHILVDLP